MAGVADLIVKRLCDAGVRTLFGVPGGGGNLDLIAAAGRAGLPFVLTTTETGGAIAAIAAAEVTGRPGACLTTLGPGAASVANGVACALLERAPIFVFTDNHASTDADRYEHQRLSHQALFAGITTASVSLAPPDTHDAIAEAFSAMRRPPVGPVHVDCPADFETVTATANWPADWALDSGSAGIDVFDSNRVSWNASLGSVEEQLSRARRPLAIAGLAARGSDHAARLRGLCEDRGIPAMVTYKAKGVVPDDHPWFAGIFTNGVIEQPLIDDSDLIIAFGLDPVELLPRPWTPRAPRIHFEDTGAIDDGLAEAESRLAPSTWDLTQIQAAVQAQRRAIAIPTRGLSAQRVVEIAAARLARDRRVTVDAGAHMFPATMLWPAFASNRMLISNGLSTMGFALPAAIGAALADRDTPVVALTGDGGLLMCLGELLTAVRERLRIIVIVFDDAALSLIEIKQQARRLAPAGVALGAIDWVAIARGFGAAGFVADDEAGLERAIASARASDGPSLIAAAIDRSNYGATLKAIRG